jgi:hypothetical protein
VSTERPARPVTRGVQTMAKPVLDDPQYAVWVLNTANGKPSHFVIRGSNFDNTSEPLIKKPADVWKVQDKQPSADGRRLRVKVKIKDHLDQKKVPKEIDQITITVTNKDMMGNTVPGNDVNVEVWNITDAT